MKTARLTELAVAYGVLFDKRRLLQGEATSHVAILQLAAQEADKLDTGNDGH